MLECQHCQHDVVAQFTILEKFQRFWLDLDQDVLFGSGLCQSLRDLRARWSAILGSSVGLRTIVSSHQSDRTALAATPQSTRHASSAVAPARCLLLHAPV